MIYIIFHGSFGSPDGNWFPELREQLEALGQKVIAPQFPCDDYEKMTNTGKSYIPKKQNLDNWLKFFKENYLKSIKGEKPCFIGHSIGPLFILHLVEKFNITLDSAIFVSPFFDLPDAEWQYKSVLSSFINPHFNFPKLKKLILVSYVIYSDSDPYVSNDKALNFAAKLDSSTIMVRKGGHLNSEVNLMKFPLIFELCKTRLDYPQHAQ